MYPTAIMKTQSGCDETVEALNGQRMVIGAQVNSRSREHSPFDFCSKHFQSVQDAEYVVGPANAHVLNW